MTQIDEFESIFKAAAKPVFHVEPIAIHKVLLLTDTAASGRAEYLDRVRQFLAVLNEFEHDVEISTMTLDEDHSVASLIEHLRQLEPDMICTYRNLCTPAIDFPYSLGVFIDVLTQATAIPILLMPRPELFEEDSHVLRNTDRVMAVTDHLAGDSYLVTYAALMTQDGGELTLAHVEDQKTFERYAEIISKLPEIDTETALPAIRDRLLKEPLDYIESCRQGIEQAGLPIQIKPLVTMGHYLSEYREVLRNNETDLLVMHTKDDDQLAMKGMAYALSVEIRDVPLLLI